MKNTTMVRSSKTFYSVEGFSLGAASNQGLKYEADLLYNGEKILYVHAGTIQRIFKVEGLDNQILVKMVQLVKTLNERLKLGIVFETKPALFLEQCAVILVRLLYRYEKFVDSAKATCARSSTYAILGYNKGVNNFLDFKTFCYPLPKLTLEKATEAVIRLNKSRVKDKLCMAAILDSDFNWYIDLECFLLLHDVRDIEGV
ncbi:hypothetical protein D3C81_09850 [compost metagenome]